MAEADGTTRIEGRIAQVELDGESGAIAALRLDGDRRIEGDLFIDCTGFRTLLIDGALHAGFEDWKPWLTCESVIAIQTHNVRPPDQHTLVLTIDARWQRRIPHQHRM